MNAEGRVENEEARKALAAAWARAALPGAKYPCVSESTCPATAGSGGLNSAHPSHSLFARKTLVVTHCGSTILLAPLRHFSTFPSPKINPLKTQIPLCLRSSASVRMKSDLSQIKLNGHKKNSQFFSGALMGNHWEIR